MLHWRFVQHQTWQVFALKPLQDCRANMLQSGGLSHFARPASDAVEQDNMHAS
jgi:hypothetical protein